MEENSFENTVCKVLASVYQEVDANIIGKGSIYTAGVRPTYDISIEFEIRPKFEVLWFKIYLTDHNEILRLSRQLHCCDVCKILLWSVEHILN